MCGSIARDRKSTRLNSSHVETSYAVFCLKKKKDTLWPAWLTTNSYRLRTSSFLHEFVMKAAQVNRYLSPHPGGGWEVVPVCFFFNDTATAEIYTLSLHDALPIWPVTRAPGSALASASALAPGPQ